MNDNIKKHKFKEISYLNLKKLKVNRAKLLESRL